MESTGYRRLVRTPGRRRSGPCRTVADPGPGASRSGVCAPRPVCAGRASQHNRENRMRLPHMRLRRIIGVSLAVAALSASAPGPWARSPLASPFIIGEARAPVHPAVRRYPPEGRATHLAPTRGCLSDAVAG